MQKTFSKCPICGSNEGYENSVFIPDVKCKWCNAEWSLRKDSMVLRRVSDREWDEEFLNKDLTFEYWKNLKEAERAHAQITEETFTPMDYLGGHTEYRKPAIGYVLLKPDSLSYKTREGSLHRMNIEIPIAKFRGLEIRTGKEISFTRWFLLGAWSILFKKRKEYLVLIYEDPSGMLQHMVLDFHGQKKMIGKLTRLVSSLKKSK